MIFFKKKSPSKEKTAPKKKPLSLQEIPLERVLTAEGWRRKTEPKAPSKKTR